VKQPCAHGEQQSACARADHSDEKSASNGVVPISSAPRIGANFVRDVNILDGAPASAGALLHKTWELKNVGNVAWPDDTRVVFVGGALRPAADMSQPTIGTTGVGESAQVSVIVRVPEEATIGATLRGHYRLTSAACGRFGHNFWIQVRIVASSLQPDAKPAPGTDATSTIATDVKYSNVRSLAGTAVNPSPVTATVAPVSIPTSAPAAPASTPASVEAKEQAPAPVATTVPTASIVTAARDFSSELATLRAMGFSDDTASLAWLQRGVLDRHAKNRLIDWTIHKLVQGK